MLKHINYILIGVSFMLSGSILFAENSGYVERSKLMQNIRLEFSVLARMSREKIEFDESLATSSRLNLLRFAASTPAIFEDDDLPINLSLIHI